MQVEAVLLLDWVQVDEASGLVKVNGARRCPRSCELRSRRREPVILQEVPLAYLLDRKVYQREMESVLVAIPLYEAIYLSQLFCSDGATKLESYFDQNGGDWGL
jgi:hypothetical protein